MFGRSLVAAMIAGAGWGAGPAMAQEDLNRGKSPAQLFASDCVDCHRSPRGLAKQDAGSLAGFLRVHYTASRESAAALAAYLAAQAPDPHAGRPAARTTPARPSTSRDRSKSQGQAAEAVAKPSEPAASVPASPAPETAPAAALPANSEPPAAPAPAATPQ